MEEKYDFNTIVKVTEIINDYIEDSAASINEYGDYEANAELYARILVLQDLKREIGDLV